MSMQRNGVTLDFTSALYLGMRHPHQAVRSWSALTRGRPAILGVPPGTSGVERRLAALIGSEQALLVPSTLHLFWDLLGSIDRRRVALYLDAQAYPIARWGAERAAARGVPVHTFPHHDAATLERLVAANRRRTPLILCDGFCIKCGQPAPLDDYLAIARAAGGRLVIDDTQALGVLGRNPATTAPYGRGGGGTLRLLGLAGPEILVIASLAKGFGVPLAVLAGETTMIKQFAHTSETRVHCSPPSAAHIHAAAHALSLNAAWGDALRRRLTDRVQQLQDRLAAQGQVMQGGWFPVQSLKPLDRTSALALHQRLRDLGVRTLLRATPDPATAQISLLVTARHTPAQLDAAVVRLHRVMKASHGDIWRS